ncbi:MAG: Dabb family protein [Phycisphaeraceae bacterium]|nr:Dabb family protein [Phycisphaerales bacterium]QOJ18642.1 MAG: Dabb family protein [Phycisphaeraceae bacterium]
MFLSWPHAFAPMGETEMIDHRAIVRPLKSSTLVLLVMMMIASGCASGSRPGASSGVVGPAPLPARISHVVFITLHDPARTEQLIADCDRLLPTIPGVTSYACGRHIDTGRASVDASYHVGLYIGFDSTEGYAVYVDHPQHVELVTKWRPEIASMLVRDWWDDGQRPRN